MQTNLSQNFKSKSYAAKVESILGKCVHCGFCNATCPTYQILGDELDGPRGRIYQMKQYFEGEAANSEFLKHLDRCLLCRSCESTCPSGVKYSELLEVGRHEIEQALPRSVQQRLFRQILVRFITSGWLFRTSINISQIFRPLIPRSLRASIPQKQTLRRRTKKTFGRKVLMLSGCAQPALTPNTNNASSNVFASLGLEVVEVNVSQCCGAAATHTSYPELGKRQARKLIDLWWPHIESGVEAIVVSATGCGVTVKDYKELFADDTLYAEKAERVSGLYRDVLEVIEENLDQLKLSREKTQRIAFHTPCTMQHGLGINHRVEKILQMAGYKTCTVPDGHLCCGSAGTYSILQPELSSTLRSNKQQALLSDAPDIIATANVGCQLQLQQGLDKPVVHWIELLDDALSQN